MADDDQESAPPDRARLAHNMRRILVLLAIIAIVLAVVGITTRLVERSHVRQRTDDAAVMTVVTTKPDPSNAGDELVLPGSVLAFMEAPIYARTSGYLKRWYFDIGARVTRGQLLAEIETPEVDRQLSQGRADLATARANADLARTTNARYQTLAAKQAVSRQDADDRAGDAAARAAAEVSAEQNVKRLEDLESFKQVLAPFDGVITARNTDVGALINAGQSANTELFRVADIHVLRIYAQVPEAYAPSVQAGLVAELHFSGYPGKSFHAKAVRTSNALDPTARTLQVELELENRAEQFLPGAYAEIHFKMPSPTQTLRVPSNTILFRSDGLTVATVGGDQKIQIKSVIQGRDFGKTVEILDGLEANDQVVVNPSDSIQSGVKVKLAPPPDQKQGGDKDQQGGNGDKQGGNQDKDKDKQSANDKDKKSGGGG